MSKSKKLWSRHRAEKPALSAESESDIFPAQNKLISMDEPASRKFPLDEGESLTAFLAKAGSEMSPLIEVNDTLTSLFDIKSNVTSPATTATDETENAKSPPSEEISGISSLNKADELFQLNEMGNQTPSKNEPLLPSETESTEIPPPAEAENQTASRRPSHAEDDNQIAPHAEAENEIHQRISSVNDFKFLKPEDILNKNMLKAIAAFIGLCLIIAYGGPLIYRLIALVYPMYHTTVAAEKGTKVDQVFWLNFWTVYACLHIMSAIFDQMFYWIPGYNLFKLSVLLWCYTPTHHNGTKLLYKHYVRPIFIKHAESLEFIDRAVATSVKTALSSERARGPR